MAFPESLDFKKQYIFNPVAESIDNFKQECENKQTDPNLHFRINKICTIATPTGRKTIKNNKFIVKDGGIRKEEIINGAEHENMLLKKHFNIVIN